MKKTLALLIIILIVAGCVGKKEESTPKAYITPCNVIGEDILIQAEGTTLGSTIVKQPLAGAFVDDLLSGQASNVYDTYSIDCWWGKNVGEQKGLYYCGGSYVTPELDLENVIKRYVKKEFKVGFNIEEHSTGADTSDKEQFVYFLTVRSASSTCYEN